MNKTFTLRVYRGTKEKQYWEEFEIELLPFLNVNAALMEIQRNPKNKKGEKVEPVVWEQGCLEEVCGSCSMLINGRPRQACTALVEQMLKSSGSNVLSIAPFSKYPLVRDLVVNRDKMFESLIKIHGWIDADDAIDRGWGPKISQKLQDTMYTLSTCMTCGCCMEGCPQMNDRSKFIGPAPISQARLFNANPTGKLMSEERTRPLMEEGGVSDCGNAQNCVQVCPKKIPLTESIAVMGREVVKQSLRDLISLPDAQ